MAGNILPPGLAEMTGQCLRQARTARGLSLAEAANEIGISAFKLSEYESGQGSLTDIHAQFIIGTYGGARGDRLDSILYDWAMRRIESEAKARRRAHLSLAGDDPKPWERPRITY